ncbi:hypothetical protein T492DRAFT_1069901 [Pavlovales sp. CCMP2436]|nr:hypothetical protein T492DRAFT_1069901 [Pavlovales sp. CCMP2436]
MPIIDHFHMPVSTRRWPGQSSGLLLALALERSAAWRTLAVAELVVISKGSLPSSVLFTYYRGSRAISTASFEAEAEFLSK